MLCVKLHERKWCDGQSSSHTAVVGTGGLDMDNEPLIRILSKDGSWTLDPTLFFTSKGCTSNDHTHLWINNVPKMS
jgi:hypothetical protein